MYLAGHARHARLGYDSGVTFSHGAKDRLTHHDLGRFAGETLFDRLGRAVCAAGVLPRKELYEAWEVARRVRRRVRGGRVVKAFENIHVYELMCALLGIAPAPNDGDPKVTRRLLRR